MSEQAHSSRVVLLSTGLSMFAVFLDTSILYVAFPSIIESFPQASPASLSWVLNAYTIVFAALLIPAGRIADRIGRRRMFLGAVVVFTIASLLCGLAPNEWLLVAGRVLQAVGAAAMVPSSMALVLQSHSREDTPRAIAIWGAIGGVAGAAGPTLGSLIIHALDWRWAFFINVPVGLISFIVGSRVLPEGREAHRGRIPDPISVLLVILALSGIAFGIVSTESHPLNHPLVLGPTLGGLLLLGLFVWLQLRITSPVLDLRLFALPTFRIGGLAITAFATGFACMFLGNVLFMTRIWDFTIVQAGFGIAAGPLIFALFAPRWGKLAGRIGQRRLIVPGATIWILGPIYLLATAGDEPAYFTVYLPAVIMTAIGASMVMPQLSSVAVRDLPADEYAQGSAVTQAARNLGTTIGVAATVAVIAAQPTLAGFQRQWWIALGCAALVLALAIALPRREPVAA